MKRINFVPGCRKSPVDGRDFTLLKSMLVPEEHLPPVFSLGHLQSPVRDQGKLGSCTAFALTGMMESLELLEIVSHEVFGGSPQAYKDPELCDGILGFSGFDYTIYSPLFVYYFERLREGTVEQDSGAYIRDGMKVLQQVGAALESSWPYEISQFKVNPTLKSVATALNAQITDYANIRIKESEIKSALYRGRPVVGGFALFDSFFSDEASKKGIIPMPKPDEDPVGGHAMLIVGYSDEKKSYLVKNSWGKKWGDSGYCWIPYEYVNNWGMDFWSVNLFE